MNKQLENPYDFKTCIRCGKPRKLDYTLSAYNLRKIDCFIKGDWACLPVCQSCYYEHLDYKLKGLINIIF